MAEIERQDTKGRWADKVSKWTHGTEAGDQAFTEEHRYDGVIRVAFPELALFVPEIEQYFNEDDPPPF